MTLPAGYDEIADAVDNERRILSDPRYREVLEKMMKGTPVSGRDARVVTRALVRACQDLQWPAKRYAHMCQSYVVGQVNDATRVLLGLGISISPTDGSVWAKDGGHGWPHYAEPGPLHQPEDEQDG